MLLNVFKVICSHPDRNPSSHILHESLALSLESITLKELHTATQGSAQILQLPPFTDSST